MQPNEAKPPYVVFENRPIEDRAASIAAGHYVGKDVTYAIITPQGSKDRIEKLADEWLKDLETAVREDRFPAQWLQSYRSIYADWKAGREIPTEGTPILTWPAVSRSQADACLNMNIRTVEDLANANEAALTGIGMGARALKERANAWLQSANETGKVAAELEQLRTENAQQKVTIETLTKDKAQLEAKVQELESELA